MRRAAPRLTNREGAVAAIDWRAHALGTGKTKRKTVGFGRYDKRERRWSDAEVHLREISIQAGTGCAIWDASILFSRWIYSHPDVIRGRSVLELGAGCGLVSLVAGHFASRVVTTDYLDPVLENLRYNVELNAPKDVVGDPDYSCMNESYKTWAAFDVTKRITVASLDWENLPKDPEQFQVIVGSELTFSLLSVRALSMTVDRCLLPGGVFYEILSDDRDGVAEFCTEMVARGFQCAANPVPEDLLGNYGTNQASETYHFFTFRRPLLPASEFPDMK